jgi:hypothetical protein
MVGRGNKDIEIQSFRIPPSVFCVSKVIFKLNGYICDCFKRRAQMDSEIFAKAVSSYMAYDKKNLDNLSQYAKKLRVYAKITDLMELLLNG